MLTIMLNETGHAVKCTRRITPNTRLHTMQDRDERIHYQALLTEIVTCARRSQEALNLLNYVNICQHTWQYRQWLPGKHDLSYVLLFLDTTVTRARSMISKSYDRLRYIKLLSLALIFGTEHPLALNALKTIRL